MTVTRAQVIDTLAELRVNRPRQSADQMISFLLRTYGGGANSIDELSPDFYFHVFCAAGGAGRVCAPRTNKAPDVAQPQVVAHVNNRQPTRLRTPMVAQLEAALAARAGKPRSKPNYVVNVGSPAHLGDEDMVPEYPCDGVKVS
jgi:hypothetical protein